MRDWSLPLTAPLSLTLSAETGSGDFDPENDQTWQILDSDGEPKGLSLQSTYGLRAKSMRILPAFELSGELRHELMSFHSSPRVQVWLPSYLSLRMRPFPEFEVTSEYWVCGSSVLAGRFIISNLTDEIIQAGMRLYSILQPGEKGLPMNVYEKHGVRILAGRSADLEPVLFLDGGARSEPAPYPNLAVHTSLSPGERHSWLWAHSAKSSLENGFSASREATASSWDAEVARLVNRMSQLVEVYTGDSGWDAAFWAAQIEARRHFVRPSRRLRSAVPVRSRTIKQGHSPSGTSSTWEPAEAWDAFYASLQILTSFPGQVRGYLETLLRLQEANGHIPAIANFSEPHQGWLHPPFLAQLALRLYRRDENAGFLKEAFQALVAFYECWFSSEHDRDQDGFPEWDHVNQAGNKSWPAFSPWFEWSKGLELKTAETVDLATLLILEGEALVKIAAVIGTGEPVESIEARINLLKERLEHSWVEGAGYKHMDHYLNETVTGKRLGVRRGSFSIAVNREFEPAVRVLMQIEGDQAKAKDLIVRIYSRGRRGPSRVEEYSFRRFDWFLDYGYLTSEKPSAEIEKIEVEGIDRTFKTWVSLGDYARDDIALLLPLAAGVPSEQRAKQMLEELIMDPEHYWRPGGIPCVPADDPDYAGPDGERAGTVNMLRNHWIGKGMLRYGYRREAGELLKNLMNPVIETLRQEKTFTGSYDPDGSRIILTSACPAGLAPFTLLLEVLGVDLITPQKVRIKPGNLFPNAFTIVWQGLEIVCESDLTIVTFPDGGVVEITERRWQLVEQLESS